MMPTPFSSSSAMSARSPSRPLSGKSLRVICDHARPALFTAASASSSAATPEAGKSRIQRLEFLISSPVQTEGPVRGERLVMRRLITLPGGPCKQHHEALVLAATGDARTGHEDGIEPAAVG